jgi:hypothetical protein
MAQLWHDYVLILDIAQGFRGIGKSLINKANWRKEGEKILFKITAISGNYVYKKDD